MQFTHILGIDIAKKSIDIALSLNQANATMINKKFANSPDGHQALLGWLTKQDLALDQVLICLENTGIYHRGLVSFLISHQSFVWVENPIQIKRSIGLQRGKNDTMDAQRIGMYAFRNQDKAKAYNPMDKSLQKVSDLLATRQRLLDAKKAILVPIQELAEVGLEQEAAMLKEACSKTLAALTTEIKGIEK